MEMWTSLSRKQFHLSLVIFTLAKRRKFPAVGVRVGKRVNEGCESQERWGRECSVGSSKDKL